MPNHTLHTLPQIRTKQRWQWRPWESWREMSTAIEDSLLYLRLLHGADTGFRVHLQHCRAGGTLHVQRNKHPSTELAGYQSYERRDYKYIVHLRYLLKLFPAEEHCVGTRGIPRAQHALWPSTAENGGLLGLGSWNGARLWQGWWDSAGPLVTEDWIPTLRADT